MGRESKQTNYLTFLVLALNLIRTPKVSDSWGAYTREPIFVELFRQYDSFYLYVIEHIYFSVTGNISTCNLFIGELGLV